jgi:hypothetical protein
MSKRVKINFTVGEIKIRKPVQKKPNVRHRSKKDYVRKNKHPNRGTNGNDDY